MFELVSRIISWRTRSTDSQSMQNQKRITSKEWKQYEKHLLEISKTDHVSVVKEKLANIHSAIQANQGFE